MPNLVKFANNAHSTLLSNLGPTDTVMTLPNGEGARFPSPTAGDFFILTIEDTAGNIEVVDCTGRTTDVLTVVRGREGTTARAFTVGATLEMRVTADMLEYLDWRAVANQNNGSVQLDGAGKILTSVLDTPMYTLGDVRFQAKLGFTPVTQGAPGTGMGTNRIYLGAGTADATKVFVQIDNNAPSELIKKVGNVVSFGGPQAAITNGAVEDDLAMGTNGAYLFSNATSWGIFHPVQGQLFNLNTTTGNAQFKGDVYGVSGRYRYATEAISIAQVTSLQATLDDKLSKTIGGTQTIASNLTTPGTVTAAAIVDTSDRAYKTNIATMAPEDAIAVIRGARAVRFHNKLTNKPEFGYVAQELQGEDALLGKGPAPEMVSVNSGGLAVAYQRMVSPLTVVAQNLLTRVDALEAKEAARSRRRKVA